MSLNQYQERAVSTPGHCTILACPGSGKTRVLSERAARLLGNEKKGRLCAVTFSKDSATELKVRILESCGDVGTRLAVGTFHSIALSQIKRFGKSQPKLLDNGSRLALLRRCYLQHKANDLSFEDAVSVIDSAKSKLNPPPFNNVTLEDIFHEYESVLRSENAMDFPDIMLTSVRLMQSGEIPPLPIRWLLVDEGQDIDEIQKEWILIHGHAGIDVTMVGDDDQSLYMFRNALGYRGLSDITSSLSSTEMTLPINYRCPPNVLEHAAKLIMCNTDRAHKKITANKTTPGEFRVIRCVDRDDEFQHMTKEIQSSPNEWLVLGRTNVLLDEVELSIVENGINYVRSDSKSIWDHSVGSNLLGLLRSVVNDSWTGIANVLVSYGMESGMVNQHSRDTANENNRCIDRLLALQQKLKNLPDDDQTKMAVELLCKEFPSWRAQSLKNRSSLVIYGIVNFLSGSCKKKNHLELLKKLAASINKISGTLSQKISILGRNVTNHVNPTVHIMTLHSSKGLEFENVWIMGVEEGNLPHTDSPTEDERRLLYVGMTRTKKNLFISSSIENGLESRFLTDAGLV